MPKTAILLATYNAEDHLEELLDSLLAQTDRDFEVYFHDDGSKDATLSIMERYISSHPGVFNGIPGPPTGGAKENFMFMLREVEADYYFFCDDDDVWLSTKVETERRAMTEAEKPAMPGSESRTMSEADASGAPGQPQPAAVFCDLQVVDESLGTISPTFFSYVDRDPGRRALVNLLVENVAPGCSIMINRPLRDLAIGLFDLSLIDMHDQWVMALASAAGTVSYVDEALVLYRQTGANEVGAVHEGVAGKLKRNLTNIISGDFKRKKREFHKQAYDLARALLSVIGETAPERPPAETIPDAPTVGPRTEAAPARSFLIEFLKTETSSKLSRISFYRRHKIGKTSGNFWYYLWL